MRYSDYNRVNYNDSRSAAAYRSHGRHRLVLKKKFKVMLYMVAFIIFATMIIPTMAGVNDAVGDTYYETYQVQVESGDTLWSIAETYMPDNMDPRKAVRILIEENDLDGAYIYPGQVIDVPDYNI